MDKLLSVHGFTASEQLGGFYLNVVRGNTEEFEGTYIFIYLGGNSKSRMGRSCDCMFHASGNH